MPKITRADIARLTGFTRAAISKAVLRGDLDMDAGNLVETDDPKNAAWIAGARERHGGKATAPKATAPKAATAPVVKATPVASPPPPPAKKKKTDTVSAPTGLGKDERDAIAAILAVKDEKTKAIIARRRKDEVDTRIKSIRVATLKRELIPRELVRQMLAGFDAALKSNFRDMPRRISAQLHAVMVAEGAREGEAMLEREISAALARATDEATKRGEG